MDIMGLVGRNVSDRGARPQVRVGRTGEMLVNVNGSRYQAVKDGLVFKAISAAAGVAPGTAVGTTAAFSLGNPIGNSKDFVLLKVAISYISGTLGPGSVVACINKPDSALPTGGTAITPICANGGVGAASGVCAEGSTLPASPSLWEVLGYLGAQASGTALGPTPALIADLDGDLILPSGGVFSVQAIAAAGTTPKVQIAVTWAEIEA